MNSQLSDTFAEVKASSPIRTSLFEREGSIWGSLKRPSLRHPHEVFPDTFKALRQRLGIPESRCQESGMIDRCRSDDSELCREMVTTFGLSEAQMRHAAERYRLGKSRSGKTIFWMMDEQGTFLDGHIGSALPDGDFASSWISTLLKRRYPEAASYVSFPHCLFGQHLLTSDLRPQTSSVCIVESERTAVVLSELFPEKLWMAYVYPANLTVHRFKPLQGRRVILFPRPDSTGAEYLSALDLADQIRSHYPSIDFHVSDIFKTILCYDQFL